MAALRFILCADDFALTDRVSAGILTLLDERRLSATGAMTNRPGWPRLARDLAAFDGAADLGLHLNLTCGAPLGAMPRLCADGSFPALRTVALAAIVAGAARAEIAGEIGRQLDAFEEAMGRPPDFVDGHQHAHVLPGVRGALLAELARRYPAGSVYVRDPSDRRAAILGRGVAAAKALTVSRLSTGLASALARAGIPSNDGFAGFSPFDPARDFRADLDRFLIRPGARHLVMCHPGLDDDGELAALDPVVASRPAEFAALRSWTPHNDARIVRFEQI